MSETTTDQSDQTPIDETPVEQPAEITYSHMLAGPDGTETPADAEPTGPPAWAERPNGRWEYWDEWETSTHAIRHWSWAYPPRNEAEIKAELAREQLAASVALQADLDASIAELADSVALLDPAAMRQPAKGFDALGFTVIGEAEINRTNESIANVAEAIQKSMAAFQANAAANAKTIEATNAVLEAVPVNAAMLSAPAE